MATKGQGAIAPLMIILVLLASVIFYVITIPPAAREQLLGNLTGTERTALDVSPGLISGVPESSLKLVSKPLSAMTVDNTPQPETRALSTQISLVRRFGRDELGNFTFGVSSKDTLGIADVNLLVTDRKGDGSLIVSVNNQVVFSGPVEVGQQVRVALPIDAIAQGSNSLQLAVSSPGWKFWQTNSYTFTNVNLVLGSYTGAKALQSQTFTLTAAELSNAKAARLIALAKQTSDKSAELTVMLNGVQLYKATPSQSAALAVDIPTNLLSSTNTLQWSVAKDGAYLVEFGQVILTTSSIEGQVKSYSFTITSDESFSLKTCELSLTRATSTETQSVTVRVNGVLNSYTFSDDTVTDDICKSLRSGSNTISLSAENDILIDSLTLKIRTR